MQGLAESHLKIRIEREMGPQASFWWRLRIDRGPSPKRFQRDLPRSLVYKRIATTPEGKLNLTKSADLPISPPFSQSDNRRPQDAKEEKEHAYHSVPVTALACASVPRMSLARRRARRNLEAFRLTWLHKTTTLADSASRSHISHP